MLAAAAVFAATGNVPLLLAAATIGVISPSGYEVGPFLAIEQAGLTQLVSPAKRTTVFAWYHLSGSFATALGAAGAGILTESRIEAGATVLDGYRSVLLIYAAMGLVLAGVWLAVLWGEPPTSQARSTWWGLGRSRRAVLRLSGLFSLDAFGGGFVVQSVVAYWFHLRFQVSPAGLGAIFFATNLLAGISALLAARLARRIGLIRTMVFTHIPSNLLLLLVPLMPSLPLAVAFLLLRYTISQMDVPARQSYTMGLVDPEERSAAAGVTGVARTTGAALSPGLAATMVASSAWMNLPFFLAGSSNWCKPALCRGFSFTGAGRTEPGA
jgi:MFS family permease